MERKLKLRLKSDVIQTAKTMNIQLCLPEENTATSHFKDDAIPDVNSICIGKQDKNTNQLISNIKDDTNAELLQTYIDNNIVQTKNFTQLDENNDLKTVPHYFLVYNVLNSSKYEKTYLADGPGNGSPINGHYECKYELLLGSEEYTRRMILTSKSINISLYEYLKDITDTISDVIEHFTEIDQTDEKTEEQNIIRQFYTNVDDEVCFTMFDEIGLPLEVPYNQREFESMIRSIRQISCEFIEDKS